MAREFESTTRRPEVSWTREGVQPPAPLYVHRDDALNIESWGSVAGANLIIRGRILLPDGTMTQLTFNHTPTTDRTRGSTDHQMTEGWLLSLLILESTGVGRRGQIWARANLIRGPGATALLMQTLCEGYVGAFYPAWWPPGRQHSSIEGPGVIRSIVGTDPAAGAEISETVPTNARWHLLSVRLRLVTSATVANRRPMLILDDGVNDVFGVVAASDQVASTTGFYFGAPTGIEHAARFGDQHLPLPQPCILQGGFRFETFTTALQVGDNWDAPRLLVEEWIEE